MCSGSEAGSYLRLIDFAYHSTLGLRVIKREERTSDWKADSKAWTFFFKTKVGTYWTVRTQNLALASR